MSYKADRIERKNRRRAIVITTLIYGGVLAFFVLKDDISWKEYMPAAGLEVLGEEPPATAVVETAEVRP